VLEVLTDRKLQVETTIGSGVLDYYSADVVSQSDYFPFGMTLPGRNSGSSDYRYAFNGKEDDSEIKGEGNSYDYGARMYDPRIGRWLTCDKLHIMAPSWSPYRAFFDNPNFWADPDGNIEWPLKGTKVANKSDLPGGKGDENTIVRTSTYKEIRNVGTSPHIGIDYRASIGTPVYSLGDGVVSGMYTTNSGIVILQVTYGDGDKLRFLHLSAYAQGVEVGSQVKEGQVIAYSGNSGGYPAHLHVDAEDKNGNTIDPEAKNYGKMTNEQFFGEGNQAAGSLIVEETLSCLPQSCVYCPSQGAETTSSEGNQTQASNSNLRTYSVTASSLNLRFGASMMYDSNGETLSKGTTLTGTGNVNGSWTEVATGDGRIGWVNSSYISKKSE
jgi:RHS repeat-associated protein